MEAKIKAKPRYSVGTWDTDQQAYTPQVGVGRSINISFRGLVRVMRRLRRLGYSAHRIRNDEGDHYDNDTSVLVERTDGISRVEVLEAWKR